MTGRRDWASDARLIGVDRARGPDSTALAVCDRNLRHMEIKRAILGAPKPPKPGSFEARAAAHGWAVDRGERDWAMSSIPYATPAAMLALARACRRSALSDALGGSRVDRLGYAAARCLARVRDDLVVFGTAAYDEAALGRRAARWAARLDRIAERRAR